MQGDACGSGGYSGAVEMSGVPRDWTDAMGLLKAVLDARDAMRDAKAGQVARDQASVAYSRQTDALVVLLAALSESHVLGRITLLLARKDRQ